MERFSHHATIHTIIHCITFHGTLEVTYLLTRGIIKLINVKSLTDFKTQTARVTAHDKYIW